MAERSEGESPTREMKDSKREGMASNAGVDSVDESDRVVEDSKKEDSEVTKDAAIVGSDSSSDEDTDSEEEDMTSRRDSVGIRGVGKNAIPAKSVGVSAVRQRATVTNFGSINLEGPMSIEIGNKTQYLGSVTVQQIVHDDGEVVVRSSESRAFLRGRFLEPPGVSSASQPRTGMVLGTTGSTPEEGGSKKGSGLLQKHLLGRRLRMATWIPVVIFSWIVFIVTTMYNFTLQMLHVQQGHPSSPAAGAEPVVLDENSKIPFELQKNQESGPILHCSVIIPRSIWLANPPKELNPMKHPVDYVIISHTATSPCDNQAECSMHVRLVQKFHVESRNWSDIGYNFLVGGDGNAYEGRGWNYVGAHAKGYNEVSIGISFIGTFIDVLPPPAQIRACKMLIKKGVGLGKISTDYKLIGHRQVSPTESPGEKLYQELQNWEHWSPEV